jgi:uncharacterized protein YaiE (UPF0345 family)
MAEYLVFWPKAAAGAYLANGGDAYVYSRALPSNGHTEVVVQLQIDADFGGNANSYVRIYPEIRNDGINWEEQDSGGTFNIPATGTFPKQVTEKYTEIAAFMRMKTRIHNGEGGGAYMAPTLLLAGVGRS